MNEALLSRIWRAQRFDRTDLRTADGRSVNVIFPGRRPGGPGPDFRGALLQIGDGSLTEGDVEIHLKASDWCTHGHDHDAAYRDVALHVVLEADASAVTDDGRIVPTLALGDRLGDPASIADLAAIPDLACHEVAARLPDPVIGDLLDELGDARLGEKAARFAGDLQMVPPDQLLYTAICEGLGYSRNRLPFRTLAERLPVELLATLVRRLPDAARRDRLTALLFGVAGLLPSQRSLDRPFDWETTAYVEELETAWTLDRRELLDGVLGANHWQFAGIRPANAPPRRLAAAACLIGRTIENGLVDTIVDSVRQGAEKPRLLVAAFEVADPESYWASHFDFGRPLGKHAARLIGADRALVLALNVAVPFAIAWADHTGDSVLAERAWKVYRQIPRPGENATTLRVLREVFGADRARLVTTARREQGLLYLDRLYCSWLGPSECPVAKLAAQKVRLG